MIINNQLWPNKFFAWTMPLIFSFWNICFGRKTLGKKPNLSLCKHAVGGFKKEALKFVLYLITVPWATEELQFLSSTSFINIKWLVWVV